MTSASATIEKQRKSADRAVRAVSLYALHKTFTPVAAALEVTKGRAAQLYRHGCTLLVSHRPTMARHPKEAVWVKLASMGMIETRCEQPRTVGEVEEDCRVWEEAKARRQALYIARQDADRVLRAYAELPEARLAEAKDAEEAEAAGLQWYQELILGPHQAKSMEIVDVEYGLCPPTVKAA